MDDNGTKFQLIGRRRADQPMFARIAPDAGFISQLIAEHQHLAPQRERRRAPLADGIGAYAAGSRIAIRRLPAGYTTTRTV
jgi:hypothetical protein